jgi:carbonic anhydrase
MTSELTRRRLVGSGVAVAAGGSVAAFLAGCGGNGSGVATTTTPSGAHKQPRSGDEALERLMAGNERYVQGQTLETGRGDVRRAEIAQEQKPFAIVLGCSDSRVPPG